MTRLADVLFTMGAVAFLSGMALVDYRAAMVVGGAAVMAYAVLLARRVRATSAADDTERSNAP